MEVETQKPRNFKKSRTTTRGVPENEINITVDARYHSNTIGNKKKPGHNATQTLALGIETMTDRKFIVAAVVQNKMCWRGA